MQPAIRLTLFLLTFALAAPAFAQTPFNNCTGAFLNGRLVVDEYSPSGKCVLAQSATGRLTVCTAELSPTESRPVDAIPFKIALRDQATKTLVMFSDENYREIDVQAVLGRCRPGDHIVLLTLDNRYALPHNEILVK